MTAVTIDGATRLYGIVGDPIAQARSPQVYTELFAAKGVNAVLVPLHVLPADFASSLPALMRMRNLDGLLVTAPYKARAVEYAARLGETARCIGALNALRRDGDGRWSGDMFDGAGFVHGAQRKGFALRGRRVALYGAGGAGSAVACELAKAGVASIAIIDPDAARAQALATTLHQHFPQCAVVAAAALPAGFDMLVNASTVGMRDGDGLPGDVPALAADTLVGDVVVSEAPTPLIRLAQRHGCPHVTGRDMHGGQIDALMAFFAPGAVAERTPAALH